MGLPAAAAAAGPPGIVIAGLAFVGFAIIGLLDPSSKLSSPSEELFQEEEAVVDSFNGIATDVVLRDAVGEVPSSSLVGETLLDTWGGEDIAVEGALENAMADPVNREVGDTFLGSTAKYLSQIVSKGGAIGGYLGGGLGAAVGGFLRDVAGEGGIIAETLGAATGAVVGGATGGALGFTMADPLGGAVGGAVGGTVGSTANSLQERVSKGSGIGGLVGATATKNPGLSIRAATAAFASAIWNVVGRRRIESVVESNKERKKMDKDILLQPIPWFLALTTITAAGAIGYAIRNVVRRRRSCEVRQVRTDTDSEAKEEKEEKDEEELLLPPIQWLPSLPVTPERHRAMEDILHEHYWGGTENFNELVRESGLLENTLYNPETITPLLIKYALALEDLDHRYNCGRKGKTEKKEKDKTRNNKMTGADLLNKLKNVVAQAKEEWKKMKNIAKEKKRGDHVINNGLLSLHKDIITRFCRVVGIESPPVDSVMSNDLERNDPLESRGDHMAIESGMVAWMDAIAAVPDLNAVLYGRASQLLVEASVSHMEALYRNDNPTARETDHSRTVRELTDHMNGFEGMAGEAIYVDENAKRAWLKQGGKISTFVSAKSKVKMMLERLHERMALWVIDLKFRKRQSN